jgi:hypothetical protein
VVWTSVDSAVYGIENTGALSRHTELKEHDGTQRSESSKEKSFGSAGDTVYCLAASADGKKVFAGTHGARVMIWDKDGKSLGKIDLAPAKLAASTP